MSRVRLQEVHLGLWLVLDEVVTSRAVPSGFEWRAARGMPRRISGKGMTRPPVCEEPKRTRQLPAFRG